MERDDVLPILVARHQVSVGVGGCHGHEAQRREVGLCCGPHLGTQSSGTEPRGLLRRVPARLGAALCSRQLAKIIDSGFCWQQD